MSGLFEANPSMGAGFCRSQYIDGNGRELAATAPEQATAACCRMRSSGWRWNRGS
jgi:hypothetical protein